MGEKIKDESIMEHRVTRLEDSVGEIRRAVNSIADSLQTLTRLEVQHAETKSDMERSFAEIASLRKDFVDYVTKNNEVVKNIEIAMPMLKLSSKWVMMGVISVVGIVGMAVVYLVVNHPAGIG